MWQNKQTRLLLNQLIKTHYSNLASSESVHEFTHTPMLESCECGMNVVTASRGDTLKEH